MATAYSGNDGVVTVNGVDICITQWTATKTNIDEDTTSVCESGWDDVAKVGMNVQGSFNFHYDPAKHDGLADEDVVPLVLTLPLGGVWSGQALLTTVQITSQVKQTVKGTASFKSKGAWVLA